MIPARASGPDPRVAVALGLAVFPLPPGGKEPPPPGWQTAATRTPDLAAWPEGANIGVGCARSGLVVLDLDVPGNGHRTRVDGAATLAAVCERLGHRWPRTLTVATPSGGSHLYYRAPAGVMIASVSGGTSGLGEGIDVRAPGTGRGGYVVGPGSVVGGRRYEVAADEPVAPLPQWLAAVLSRRALSRRPAGRGGERPLRRGRALPG